MSRVVALLQGVNLAGKRRVPMPELRARLAERGYEDVVTYLASGNVVLSSPLPAADLERELTAELAGWLGFDVPVLVRTHAELAEVVERDLLGSVVDDPARYQVSFLSAPPDPRVLRELEGVAVPPERIELHGRELYGWHPNGLGRSKLAAFLTAKRLGVLVTARNWNTVTKLVELTRRC